MLETRSHSRSPSSGTSASAHPRVRSDVVVFSIHDERLAVLLESARAGLDEWHLPGACVAVREGVDDCASRVLRDQADLAEIYIEQLRTFGSPERDPRAWTVSVAYLAICDAERAAAHRNNKAAPGGGMRWFDIGALPPLVLDHEEIVRCAHERLMAKLHYSTIGLAFMPAMFTLSDLQNAFETVLGSPLDKRNFRRRMLALDCLEATRRTRRDGSHRPARLYRTTCPGLVQYIR